MKSKATFVAEGEKGGEELTLCWMTVKRMMKTKMTKKDVLLLYKKRRKRRREEYKITTGRWRMGKTVIA